MPTTSPLALSSGSPAATLVAAGEELMEGMPPAGPLAMAVATPVTAPGVQCSATEAPPAGTKLRVRSGVPPPRPASSANGATGRSSGTVTSATSEALSVATTVAGSSLPPGPTMTMRCVPTRRSAVVATRPPSATAMPISATGPRPVVTWSSTMERPAAWAAAGTALSGPASVVGTAATVSRVVLSGRVDAGESSTTTQAITAITATTPTRTMTAPR